MTKWTLSEGRTAIDYTELYQAAKRDAEEAEAYAAELEAKLAKAEVFVLRTIRYAGNNGDDFLTDKARAALAELKGERDE